MVSAILPYLQWIVLLSRLSLQSTPSSLENIQKYKYMDGSSPTGPCPIYLSLSIQSAIYLSACMYWSMHIGFVSKQMRIKGDRQMAGCHVSLDHYYTFYLSIHILFSERERGSRQFRARINNTPPPLPFPFLFNKLTPPSSLFLFFSIYLSID